MKITELYKLIAKREGKKSEVSIGNIREIVGIIADVIYADSLRKDKPWYDTHMALLRAGDRRSKRLMKQPKTNNK